MTTLTTARLVLASWQPEDEAEAFALWSDPAVMRYVGAPFTTMERSGRAIRSATETEARHGVCLWRLRSAEGEPLGCCGFHVYDGPGSQRPGTRWLELAYHLRPTAWGRGYATEAARRCLEHARLAAWTHVVAFCDPLNLASRHVLDKLGFHRDGVEGEQTRHRLVL